MVTATTVARSATSPMSPRTFLSASIMLLLLCGVFVRKAPSATLSSDSADL